MKFTRVIIATHINFIPGIAQEWINYLKPKTEALIVIKHPEHKMRREIYRFRHYPSEGTLYINKNPERVYRNPRYQAPFLVSFLFDLVLSLLYIFKLARSGFHVFLGVDCLNAFVGIALRKFGIVKYVIFYVVDYAYERFRNPVMNEMYQFLVRFALRNSDLVWAGSSAVVSFSRQFVSGKKVLLIPHGVHLPKKTKTRASQGKRMVYVGGLDRQVGLELVIDSLPDIIKKIPEVRLYVIGGGGIERNLKKMVLDNNLQKYVSFLGIMPNRKVMSFLQECDIGLAPYQPDSRWIFHFSGKEGSMKIKEYLASELPIITTKATGLGLEAGRNQAGIVINYNKQEFVNAAVKLLTDEHFYNECRKNTKALVAKYEWSTVLSNAWTKSCSILEDINAR